MRVLFLGTPEFACVSLQSMIDAGHDVVGVVTRPDRRSGRGLKVAPSPVKALAQEREIPVLQPVKVNASETLDEFRALAPDVLVVTAFGAILRKPLLDLAPYRSINVHASLLPAYRGVAPAQWALIHGQRTTGVTTMLMDEGVDTGPILERRDLEIHPMETAGDLLARLAQLGGDLLVNTLNRLYRGELVPVPQPENGASYAPKLLKEHGYLDLSLPAHQVMNQFRGVTPAPGARVFLENESIRVQAMRALPEHEGNPYEVLEVAHRHLRVGTGAGAIDLLRVRPPGKGDMEGADFARGRRLGSGSRLTLPPEIPDLSPRVAVAR